jgi:hypothetical protein
MDWFESLTGFKELGYEETRRSLEVVGQRLQQIDDLRGNLRIGLHWNVEVTVARESGQYVSQAFCSALPVSYTHIPQPHWQSFATLVLEAAYEATLWAAALNAAQGSSRTVFLTRLGGGSFGNKSSWIDARRCGARWTRSETTDSTYALSAVVLLTASLCVWQRTFGKRKPCMQQAGRTQGLSTVSHVNT